MITALLVDDEPAAVRRLGRMLAEFPDIAVIGTARNVPDAEQFLRGRVPDLIFLDVTMPGRLGTELIASVLKTTSVIFVTANPNYAVEAFERGAVDFLLKPFDRDRLGLALDRLRARLPASPAVAADAPPADDGAAGKKLARDAKITLAMERGRSSERVSVADITWIVAKENYSQVQIRGRQPVLIKRMLSEWESMLPEPPFHRLDRSLIVQIDRVVRTQRQSRDLTLLFLEGVRDPLPVGRAATARLRQLINA